MTGPTIGFEHRTLQYDAQKRNECHFTALRKFALDNTDYRSHPKMQAGIRDYLRRRNGNRTISLRSWKWYKTHRMQPTRRRKAG